MLELKEYLQARGVTVTGYLKPALVEIANAVQKMMLPLDPNFECRDDSERKLIIHENEIEDPFVNSHDALDYFNDSPPFGLYDIFNYLIYHTTDYDKQGLAAYKSFDDYLSASIIMLGARFNLTRTMIICSITVNLLNAYLCWN